MAASPERAHSQVFSVGGQHSFPMEMLAVERCFPLGPEDAEAIRRSYRAAGDRSLTVRLKRTIGTPIPPSEEGWRTRGWLLLPGSFEQREIADHDSYWKRRRAPAPLYSQIMDAVGCGPFPLELMSEQGWFPDDEKAALAMERSLSGCQERSCVAMRRVVCDAETPAWTRWEHVGYRVGLASMRAAQIEFRNGVDYYPPWDNHLNAGEVQTNADLLPILPLIPLQIALRPVNWACDKVENWWRERRRRLDSPSV